MRNHLSNVRGLVVAGTFVICIILSFKGFPLALVSWVGFIVLGTGYAVAFSTIFHANEDSPKTGLGRFFLICIAFAVASLGGEIISWGGLISFDIFNLNFNLQYTGALVGTVSGIFNLDKTWGGVDAETQY